MMAGLFRKISSMGPSSVLPTRAAGTVAAFVRSWVAALPAEALEPSTVKHYAESVAFHVRKEDTSKNRRLYARQQAS